MLNQDGTESARSAGITTIPEGIHPFRARITHQNDHTYPRSSS